METNLVSALLARCALFAPLDESALGALAQTATVRTFRPGDALFYEGDPGGRMYVIASGTISLERIGSKDAAVRIATRREGEVIGELSVFEELPRTTDARVVETAQIVMLDGRSILHAVRHSPELAIGLIRILSAKLRESVESQLSVGDDPLPIRVAKELVTEAKHGEKVAGTGTVLSARLTQRELAARVGASREAVNRVIADLRHEGIVEVSNNRIVVRSLRALRERAEA